MPRLACIICLKVKKETKVGMVNRLLLGLTMDKEKYTRVRVSSIGMKSNGILKPQKASLCRFPGLRIDMENASN